MLAVPLTAPGTTQSTRSKAFLVAGFALLSLCYLAGLLYYAGVRPVEADEGYYISAARLAWEGKIPYHDFSYPQGILLPYLYGWVGEIVPHSLVALRGLSAIFGAAAVAFWGIFLLRLKRLPTSVALATLAVIVLDPYWVSWNVVVKTFASANLFMTVALICLYGALHKETRKLYFAGGLALGACACVRSLYAPLIPLAVLWLLRREWRMTQWRLPGTIVFTAGATCGVLPMILAFAVDPAAFVFNNFRYRNLLNPHLSLRHVLGGLWTSAIATASHGYLLLTLALAAIGLVSLWRLRRKRDATPYSKQDFEYLELALLLLLAYVVISCIPFPIYDQYFTSPLLPFLVLFMAEGLRVLIGFGPKAWVPAAVLALLLFLPGLKMEIQEYSLQPEMQLASYRKVAQSIQDNSSAGDSVLSIWPGYVFQSGRQFFPGSEDHFNYGVGYQLTPQQRMQFHVLSKFEVVQALNARATSMYVSGWSEFHLESTMTREERKALQAALDLNYRLVGTVDHVSIYRVR